MGCAGSINCRIRLACGPGTWRTWVSWLPTGAPFVAFGWSSSGAAVDGDDRAGHHGSSVIGASGGVGSVAAQYAVRAGARVIGLTSRRHFDLLHQLGVEPVLYGDGEQHRIQDTAGDEPITAFIDAVGDHYIDLALALGVAPGRIDTVVNYAGAKVKGVKALGTRDAGGLDALAELADLAERGELLVPIGATYSLQDVRDAYRALRDRRAHGRIVLHPQDVA